MSQNTRTAVSDAHWAEIRSLFERCEPLDADARRRLLDTETAGKPWLREEVESLLAKSGVSDEFLGAPLARQLAAVPAAPSVPAEPARPFAPFRLGRYFLFHRLGRGGMAEVFLAKVRWANGFDRIVAVKRIHSHFADDPELKSLFELEARLSAQLAHGNIVHVYDYGAYEGHCLLAMEFVNGANLADVMQRVVAAGAAVPSRIALALIASVVDALEHAHSRRDETSGQPLGLVHRDVSPKNIIVSFDGEVKLVDFGIAKVRDRSRFTGTGQVRGTTRYLSPEAVAGEPVDSRHDLFAACLCLYELLSGKPLFSAEAPAAIVSQIRAWTVPSPRIDSLGVGDDVKAVLSRGLAPIPADRFQTAGELRAVLAGTIRDGLATTAEIARWIQPYYEAEREERRRIVAGAADLSVDSAAKKPWRWKRWKRWALGAIFLAVAVFALGGVVETRHRRKVVHDACASDAARLCPASDWGSGLGKCLAEHGIELSSSCQSAMKRVVPKSLPGH